ncbi:hypothetical protein D3C71_21630 [compost metagenome]
MSADFPKPSYEYRVTFTLVPDDFPNHDTIAEDLAKIAPKPPRGADWQLASSTSVRTSKGNVVYYHWERTARERPAGRDGRDTRDTREMRDA